MWYHPNWTQSVFTTGHISCEHMAIQFLAKFPSGLGTRPPASPWAEMNQHISGTSMRTSRTVSLARMQLLYSSDFYFETSISMSTASILPTSDTGSVSAYWPPCPDYLVSLWTFTCKRTHLPRCTFSSMGQLRCGFSTTPHQQLLPADSP